VNRKTPSKEKSKIFLKESGKWGFAQENEQKFFRGEQLAK